MRSGTVTLPVRGAWVLLRQRLPAWPEGWFGFCFRTWISVVLALAAAFWLQLENAGSAAVCVAILAQPTRGQSLSKGLYRMGGTVLGAGVALLLLALFPQDRFMLLAGIALWIALCTIVGSVTRDFRAYAAVLSGYTVSIVAIEVIDTPQQAFDSASSRLAVIALGVVVVTLVNQLFGSPETWTRLAASLRRSADRVSEIADDAVAGRPLPDETETATLASGIIALTSQASYARTELQDGRNRIDGADSAMLALLEMLSCARAIQHALQRGDVDPAVVAAMRRRHENHGAVDDAILPAEMVPPDPAGIHIHERSIELERQRRYADDGIAVLVRGSAPMRRVRIRTYVDRFAAGLNATRILIAFTIGCAFCILSGQPDSTLALIQVSAMCALAATNPNPTGFAFGVLIGAPLAVICSGLVNFVLLTQGSALPLLAISLIPPIFFACTLVMIPATGSIGFITLVFTLVLLDPANTQSFDLLAYSEQATMFLASAVIVFLALVLVLPVAPRWRLLRGAASIAEDIERRLDREAPLRSPALISRQYDRLAQLTTWNGRIGPAQHRRFVLARLTGLTDLVGALGRVHLGLDRAEAIPALHEVAGRVRSGLRRDDLDGTLRRMDDGALALMSAGLHLPPAQRQTMLRAVSGLHGAAVLLRAHRRMLALTGVVTP